MFDENLMSTTFPQLRCLQQQSKWASRPLHGQKPYVDEISFSAALSWIGRDINEFKQTRTTVTMPSMKPPNNSVQCTTRKDHFPNFVKNLVHFLCFFLHTDGTSFAAVLILTKEKSSTPLVCLIFTGEVSPKSPPDLCFLNRFLGLSDSPTWFVLLSTLCLLTTKTRSLCSSFSLFRVLEEQALFSS